MIFYIYVGLKTLFKNGHFCLKSLLAPKVLSNYKQPLKMPFNYPFKYLHFGCPVICLAAYEIPIFLIIFPEKIQIFISRD